MSNKKLGNDFEGQLCEILSNEGFWCHLFAQNQAGQPADIIAVRNKKAYLIDCKVCSNGRFDFSRIEDNQDLAMEHWKTCGNGDGWFAILMSESNDIYMIPRWFIRGVHASRHSLSKKEIEEDCSSLREWLVE